MKTKRIFLAHAKAEDNVELLVGHVTAALTVMALQANATGVVLHVVPGREDFERRFKQAGSWDAWIREIIHGTNYGTAELRYHGVVVPDRFVGNATRMIVEQAIAARRPCLFYDRAGQTLSDVRGIVRIATGDWRQGWEIIT